MPKTIHQGRNVKRFREMLGIKQEALAFELGDDWNQRKVSVLEQKEEIEPEQLEQLARVLKVPAEAIKNFDEETAIFNIQHNYEDHRSIPIPIPIRLMPLPIRPIRIVRSTPSIKS
ncbi:helix-turn-helix domain-containing protein [Larkinella soli]|uniref:helix-turn-helix domain-containing protein n=1 Tax=Larkinella soli TaxID=1770527 RepID=UPI000FFB6B90|nr:helix-turn-helix transcriptional regulator [Larkinella soli]